MSVLYDKFFPIFYTPFKTVLKIFVTILCVGLILAPCVLFLKNKRPSGSPKSFTSEHPEVKTILYWTKVPLHFIDDGELFRECTVSACRATADRNLMKVDDFDAVLFHGFDGSTSSHDLPSERYSRQKYVFVDPAPPENRESHSFHLRDEFYNWTMAHRRDSDVPMAHGYFINSETKNVAYPVWARNNTARFTFQDNQISRKDSEGIEGVRKTAVWFPSRFQTAGFGNRYVDELRKYVDVDICGGCSPSPCEFGDERCCQTPEGRYHFFITFEDPLCQDYVSEKFREAMRHGVVPIVYGAVNYSGFAPPGSFVTLADFEGPEELGNRLKHLISKPEEYGRFFSWRKHLFFDVNPQVAFCKICEMLHDPRSLALSGISDLGKWREKECSARVLPGFE